MTTHYYTSSSLDGFIATLDHSLAWLFEHDIDTDGPMAYPAFLREMGALVMGAATYEWLTRNEETWPYSQPTWVLTHRELPAIGGDIRFVQGAVGELFPAIRTSASGQDVWVMGGGDLAGQFADAGLLDEVWVQYAPVTLGQGRPLLPRRLNLSVVDVARNRDFVCARYRVVDVADSG